MYKRLPFSPDYEFIASRNFTLNGVELAPGDPIDKALVSNAKLRQLYELRKITPNFGEDSMARVAADLAPPPPEMPVLLMRFLSQDVDGALTHQLLGGTPELVEGVEQQPVDIDDVSDEQLLAWVGTFGTDVTVTGDITRDELIETIEFLRAKQYEAELEDQDKEPATDTGTGTDTPPAAVTEAPADSTGESAGGTLDLGEGGDDDDEFEVRTEQHTVAMVTAGNWIVKNAAGEEVFGPVKKNEAVAKANELNAAQ